MYVQYWNSMCMYRGVDVYSTGTVGDIHIAVDNASILNRNAVGLGIGGRFTGRGSLDL